jgi:hypothetical protein
MENLHKELTDIKARIDLKEFGPAELYEKT